MDLGVEGKNAHWVGAVAQTGCPGSFLPFKRQFVCVAPSCSGKALKQAGH